jgi:hypothetical protein
LAGERFGRLAEGLPKMFGEGASGAPVIYAHLAISVKVFTDPFLCYILNVSAIFGF